MAGCRCLSTVFLARAIELDAFVSEFSFVHDFDCLLSGNTFSIEYDCDYRKVSELHLYNLMIMFTKPTTSILHIDVSPINDVSPSKAGSVE